MRSTPRAPDSLATCPVCGKPTSSEPTWFDGQNLVHTRCRDWEGQPFPFDWELDRLRKLSRALRGALRSVDDAGVWLAGVKARWPADARVRLDEWAVRRTRLAAELREFVERVGRLK